MLSGRDTYGYEITEGKVRDLRGLRTCLEMEPEERACEGVFLAFQYPVEIPGVKNEFPQGGRERDPQAVAARTNWTRWTSSLSSASKKAEARQDGRVDLLKRAVNEGFSGGEKKRNEVFQMAVLEPKLC